MGFNQHTPYRIYAQSRGHDTPTYVTTIVARGAHPAYREWVESLGEGDYPGTVVVVGESVHAAEELAAVYINLEEL